MLHSVLKSKAFPFSKQCWENWIFTCIRLHWTPISYEYRNIKNLRYADDTTLMAESKEALKSLLMRVKEGSEKTGLKLSIQKLRSRHLVPLLHGK